MAKADARTADEMSGFSAVLNGVVTWGVGVLQLVLCVVIVAGVATSLTDWDIGNGQQATCLLGTDVEDNTLCVYSYVAAGVSMFVTLVLMIAAVACAKRRGVLHLEWILALLTTVWWFVAGAIITSNVKDANDENNYQTKWRKGVAVAMWILFLLFALQMILAMIIVSAASCAACCNCLGKKKKGEHMAEKVDVEATAAPPAAPPATQAYPPIPPADGSAPITVTTGGVGGNAAAAATGVAIGAAAGAAGGAAIAANVTGRDKDAHHAGDTAGDAEAAVTLPAADAKGAEGAAGATPATEGLTTTTTDSMASAHDDAGSSMASAQEAHNSVPASPAAASPAAAAPADAASGMTPTAAAVQPVTDTAMTAPAAAAATAAVVPAQSAVGATAADAGLKFTMLGC